MAGDEVDDPIYDDRRKHRQHAGHHHFLDRRLGQKIDTGGVIRLSGAIHDARDFPELAAHLDDHLAAGAADRHHAQGAEQERQQSADEQPDDHIGVLQVEVDRQVREVMRQVLGIGGEQNQRRQSGGADGVTLGHRLGGIADRIQGIGGLADFFGQIRHFGDAPGVVGDRPEGIQGDDYSRQSQHGGGGDRQPEKPGADIGNDNTAAYHNHRHRGGFHGHRQALDDVGAVARVRGLGDALHRAVFGAGIVFGDPDDQSGDAETGE